MKIVIIINWMLFVGIIIIFSYCINRDIINGDKVCGDCGQAKCIYQQIDKVYDLNKGMDINTAIKEICKQRNITDTNTIKLISANY